ncbi:MAG: MarR family winged helix-turn-helix transcriptional regulator [Pseudomonadota bacterium]
MNKTTPNKKPRKKATSTRAATKAATKATRKVAIKPAAGKSTQNTKKAAVVSASNAPLEDLIQVRLGRIKEVINQLARFSIGARGLRSTDLRIMNLLFDSGTLSINELARRSRVDKAWVSRSVTQLLQKRWVSKESDPADARAQLIRLTPKSQDMLEKLRPIVQRNERVMLQGINEVQLKRQLDLLLANASDLLEATERLHKNNKRK